MGIFKEKSLRLIKHQKARSKLFEFRVEKELYPNLSDKIENLLLQSHFSLFEYCFSIYLGETNDELKDDLEQSFEYFEAASRDENVEWMSNDLLFLGAISAFVLGNFASSKVLFSKINSQQLEQRLQVIIVKFARHVFSDYVCYKASSDDLVDLLIQNYINEEISYDKMNEEYRKLEQFFLCDIENIGYYYFLYALCFIYEKNKASRLLPDCSEISLEGWADYLKKRKSIRLLWESQKTLCENGFLKGKSGVISLPTGSGKTKGIELVVQARLLRGELNKVLIVAPLKALVNEIKDELKIHYGSAVINSISDANIEDYNEITDSEDFQIVVLTPEKLTYILYHQNSFLDVFQLIIFDEAHMIMEGNRGVNYELLLMYVKSHITERHQLILLTAVITNPQEICNWFFDENTGVTINNKKLFSTSKSIGFFNPETNSISFYENRIPDNQEWDYSVPRILRLPRENRLDKNTSTVCLVEQISTSGPTVIYIPKQTLLPNFLKKVIEIVPVIQPSDNLLKIINFIKRNYGENSLIYIAATHGYFCHYGHIQNGIKLLIENSFKNGAFDKLVATSTLSEGVNLPIKNFVITGTRMSDAQMTIPKFKNLYGRAVRLGKFTNGNVISMELVDSDMDSRKMHYTISRYEKYINEDTEAPCISSIDVKAMYNFLSEKFNGSGKIDRAINIINQEDMYDDLLKNEYFIEFLESFYKYLMGDKNFNTVLETIENYLSTILYNFDDLSVESFKTIVEASKKTFAYAKNEDVCFKSFTSVLFAAVGADYLHMDLEKRAIFTSSMCTKMFLDVALPWVDSLDYSIELIETICDKVVELYYDSVFSKKHVKRNNQPKISRDEFCRLLNDWTSGNSILEMCSLNLENKYLSSADWVERIARNVFDYDLSLFVSNMSDVLKLKEEHQLFNGLTTININEECVSKLTVFIERMKSGLPDYLAIEFYKNIFQDRLLSMKLYNMFEDKNISYADAISKIRNKQELVLDSFR